MFRIENVNVVAAEMHSKALMSRSFAEQTAKLAEIHEKSLSALTSLVEFERLTKQVEDQAQTIFKLTAAAEKINQALEDVITNIEHLEPLISYILRECSELSVNRAKEHFKDMPLFQQSKILGRMLGYIPKRPDSH